MRSPGQRIERPLTSTRRGRPGRRRVRVANLDGGGERIGRYRGRLERNEARREFGETAFGGGRVVAGDLERFDKPGENSE